MIFTLIESGSRQKEEFAWSIFHPFYAFTRMRMPMKKSCVSAALRGSPDGVNEHFKNDTNSLIWALGGIERCHFMGDQNIINGQNWILVFH
ncbi:hypothetical protein CEXT_493591 [Caerostris extrusa]|uniref:Uncharacterized protein n=1 Tax=Caerostris extrusa TaxID=172846 RepID=A0AAV4SBK0_CAEEX|nr:hypothetical protein CEXT_493591 [Caerostris extrusa]